MHRKETSIARHNRRFFVLPIPEVGESITLTGEEAHHLLGVTRVRAGDEVTLIDGTGITAQATVMEVQRREAVLQIATREALDVEPSCALTLACAVPRGPRMDFLVEKCCELGVQRLIPMVTARSVVDPTTRPENHLRRWRRIVIETLKQCGRSRMMEIDPPVRFDSLPLVPPDGGRIIIASLEPDARSFDTLRAELGAAPILAFIGPEGDFTPEELQRVREAGGIPVSLGKRILRVETAAIALAAALLVGD